MGPLREITANPQRAPASRPVQGLVWAFRFRADGEAELLPTDQPLDLHDLHEHSPGEWLWLHFNLTDLRACDWIGSAAQLPQPARALLLSTDDHQQLHVRDTCLFGVLADLKRDLDRVSQKTGRLRFAITEHIAVSGRRHALQSVEATRHAIESGRRLTTAAALLEAIVEHIAETIGHIAEDLATQLDQIEDRVLDERSRDESQKLGRLRRAAVRLHRPLVGLRALLHRLDGERVNQLKPELRFAAERLAQRLDGLDNEVIALQERARLLQEEVAAKIAAETNRNLYVLSILTALFLPPTLVAGILGMNTGGLPLSDVHSGFLWAIILCTAAAAGTYWRLRKMGLFG
jgi:zinc transporter